MNHDNSKNPVKNSKYMSVLKESKSSQIFSMNNFSSKFEIVIWPIFFFKRNNEITHRENYRVLRDYFMIFLLFYEFWIFEKIKTGLLITVIETGKSDTDI